MNIFHLGKEKTSSLHQLFLSELRNLYSAETQLVNELPKLAEASHDENLKQDFLNHLDETREHVTRLETIFNHLEEIPTGQTCKAMEALIKEGRETVHEDSTPEVKDASLIAAAQRVEHFEIAGYGVVRSYAHRMGFFEFESLLQTTLEEEEEADKTLTSVSHKVNYRIPIGKENEEIPAQGEKVSL